MSSENAVYPLDFTEELFVYRSRTVCVKSSDAHEYVTGFSVSGVLIHEKKNRIKLMYNVS